MIKDHGEDAPSRLGAIHLAGLASLGAGAIHAAAAGVHAENPTLSRLFVATAAAQLVAGLLLLVRGGRVVAGATALVNAGAVVAWAVTRTTGISWIDGLEQSESPQFADTTCAVLGALATAAAVVALARGRTTSTRAHLALPGAVVGAVTVVAMMAGATNVHSHADADAGHAHADDTAAAADDHTLAEDAAAGDHTHTDEAAATDDHTHTDEAAATDDHAGHGSEAVAAAWPRPWDPAAPIDFSGVPGVSAEQQARAEALVASTLRDLPQFADVATVADLGYRSIGDAASGFEHYVNFGYIVDDAFLDPSRPESLVYEVDGDERTLGVGDVHRQGHRGRRPRRSSAAVVR